MTADQEQPVEIEAKFTIADESLLRKLSRQNTALAGYRFGPITNKDVVDTYLDTASCQILRAGYQLRARQVAGTWLATLKSRNIGNDVGIYQRLEIEEPLDRAELPTRFSDLPEPIIAALSHLDSADQPLTVICVLDQERQRRDVLTAARGHKRAESTPIALLSLDRMTVRQHADGPILARAFEIEVELAPGVDVAELHVLADRLIGAFALTPSQESKLERALTIISRHPIDAPEDWQGLHPQMHMGEACRVIWYEQFMKLLLSEAGVRYSSDPEYVHDARVAIRRTRAAARIYQDYFKPKAVRKYLKQLRNTARLLGAVRDLDVAIARLDRYQQKSNRRSRVDLQATIDGWRSKRAAAYRSLVKWLDSKDYAEFVADFLRFCRTPRVGIVDMQPRPGEEIIPFQVRHVAPSMLMTNFEHVRSYELWFEQPEIVPVETMHRLRIECKYLRYNLEFMAGLLGPESTAIIDLLRKLQDDLGDLNDAVVSQQLLSTSGADNDDASVGRYERDQQLIIDRLRFAMIGDFTRFVAEENRVRLLGAIARI
jgi:CHAD domain-containing protein